MWSAVTRRSVPCTSKLPREWRSIRERRACNAWHMFRGSVPMPDHRPPTFAAAARVKVPYARHSLPRRSSALRSACNCEAMQLHLDEIATKVAPGAHAVILLDQAGWHGAKALVVPSNVSLVPLRPSAPELNGQGNIWQFMRQNWLSNRIFKSFDDIVDHCCYAW